MKTCSWLLLAVSLVASPRVFSQPVAPSYPARTPDQIDELVSPIALYPDPLVGVILPASTDWPEIQAADQFLRSNAGPEAIDAQPWDESVKALAQYPQVVSWMIDNLEWTQEVGATFVTQPAEVMNSIQRLRASARASGILVDTPQQRVVVQGTYISITPAQPDVVYVPVYDPEIIYAPRGRAVHRGSLSFSIGFAVGPRPVYGMDWNRRTIWVDRSRHVAGRTTMPVTVRTEREEWHPRREVITRYRTAPARVNTEVVHPRGFQHTVPMVNAERLPAPPAPVTREERPLAPTGRVPEESINHPRLPNGIPVPPSAPAPAIPRQRGPREEENDHREQREERSRVMVPVPPASAPEVQPRRGPPVPGEQRALENRHENPPPPEAKPKNPPRRPESEPRKDGERSDDDRGRDPPR